MLNYCSTATLKTWALQVSTNPILLHTALEPSLDLVWALQAFKTIDVIRCYFTKCTCTAYSWSFPFPLHFPAQYYTPIKMHCSIVLHWGMYSHELNVWGGSVCIRICICICIFICICICTCICMNLCTELGGPPHISCMGWQ